jgi:hypothetical protein
LGFICAHSVWRFAIRQQKPSLVHAAISVMAMGYVAKDFSFNMMQFEPTIAAGFALGTSAVCAYLIVRHETQQEHPWN